MNQRELEREGVDLKLVFLLLVKKIPIVIISALAGALLCGSLYGIWHSKMLGRRAYEARSQYYITFEEIEDKTFFDYYYNGYTWNDLLSSDLILGYAMGLLPAGYDRQYVDDCVEAEILSDVRVLTTTAAAKDADEAKLLQQAVEQAVVHYAADGEKLERIEVIRSEEPVLEEVSGHMLRAAATGAAGFTLAAVLVLLLMIAVRDAVYLPQEIEGRFGVPCAGIECKDQKLWEELALNEERLCHGTAYPAFSVQELLNAERMTYEQIRAQGGVVVKVPQGKENSGRLSRVLHNLSIQECPVVYTKITEADEWFVKTYYRAGRTLRGRADKPRMEE